LSLRSTGHAAIPQLSSLHFPTSTTSKQTSNAIQSYLPVATPFKVVHPAPSHYQATGQKNTTSIHRSSSSWAQAIVSCTLGKCFRLMLPRIIEYHSMQNPKMQRGSSSRLVSFPTHSCEKTQHPNRISLSAENAIIAKSCENKGRPLL